MIQSVCCWFKSLTNSLHLLLFLVCFVNQSKNRICCNQTFPCKQLIGSTTTKTNQHKQMFKKVNVVYNAVNSDKIYRTSFFWNNSHTVAICHMSNTVHWPQEQQSKDARRTSESITDDAGICLAHMVFHSMWYNHRLELFHRGLQFHSRQFSLRHNGVSFDLWSTYYRT